MRPLLAPEPTAPVEPDAIPIDPLLEELGQRAMRVVCRVDEGEAQRDLARMLDEVGGELQCDHSVDRAEVRFADLQLDRITDRIEGGGRGPLEMRDLEQVRADPRAAQRFDQRARQQLGAPPLKRPFGVEDEDIHPW